MESAILDLVIQEGATFTLFFTWYQEDTDQSDPVDLTDYTARMKIKRTSQKYLCLKLSYKVSWKEIILVEL
jgi:hypothetical protein